MNSFLVPVGLEACKILLAAGTIGYVPIVSSSSVNVSAHEEKQVS